MHVHKKVLARLKNVYAVSAIKIQGKIHFMAATEEQGECLLFTPPRWKVSKIWDEPGGTMSVVPLKNKLATFVAIQKFFPIFQAEKACIVCVAPQETILEPWRVRKVIDLPFVHRLATVNACDKQYLVASTLCGGKSFRDDWSMPGGVYMGRIPEDPSQDWKIKTVFGGIHKNHGLHVARLGGQEVVLVSGTEGVFMFKFSQKISDWWTPQCLIDHEVSDIFAADIDNDGENEIITIEPFHGNTLAIYKFEQERWGVIFKTHMEFGHALWGGKILGKCCVVVGCRQGKQELAILFPEKNSPLKMRRTVVDENVGPASVVVVHNRGCELIVSANHGSDEVALYQILP